MTIERPMPITTEANGAMSESESLVITRNLLKAREKSRAHGANYSA